MSELKSPEWSATFQRARTETVVFSLLFYIFSHVNVSLARVPLLGIDIPGGAPRGTVLLFIFVFWAYFWGAWIIRFVSDRRHEAVNADVLQKFITDLETLAAREQWSRNGEDPVFRELAQGLKDTRYVIDLIPSIDQLRVACADLASFPPAEPHSGGQQSSHSVILSYFEALGTAGGQGRELLEPPLQKVERLMEDIKSELVILNETLPGTNLAFRQQADALLRQMRSLRSASVWDRVWWGFAIPISFSTGIVLYSLVAVYHQWASTLDNI